MPTPWYKDPVTQAYNPPIEPGEDIGTPFHTPITALLPGTVAGVTYGGFGARIDVMTPKGDVYYQHLDTVDVKKGQKIGAGQVLGLSGGQLSGGNLPNSPLNSTGPHVEVGYGSGGNPAGLINAGPQGGANGNLLDDFGHLIGQIGGSTAGAASAPSSGGGGGLVNINVPDPVATLKAWIGGLSSGAIGSITGLVKDNIVPLVVAALIIVIVLGVGSQQQSSPQPQIVPVPV